MKTGDVIPKPWGSERIVDLNDRYCIKHLVVRRGHRLSKQYHERKRETVLLLDGEATLTLFDGTHAREVPLMPGEAHVIEPGTIHRIVGRSEREAVILEVSSLELEDVVRIEDDYDR